MNLFSFIDKSDNNIFDKFYKIDYRDSLNSVQKKY